MTNHGALHQFEILSKKVTPSTVDKKGNKFTIMSFSNLRDDQKVIKIMAFGDIHKSHWKTQLVNGDSLTRTLFNRR